MIKTANLDKIYERHGIETVALKNVSIEISQGEFICIVGPSGCGKTTLLNMIGLLDTPTGGKLSFMGEDLSDATNHHKSNLRRNHIGFVFQSFNLIEELTIYENIEMPLIYQRVPKKERKVRVERIMERLQIQHKSKNFPAEVSGGQQQRAAVARAMVSEPKLVLADEPTGNLDSVNGQEVMELLIELNNAGTTIVMVTHSSIATDYCSRVINLFDGQVVTENIKKAMPTTDDFHLPKTY